jgi:hypothetical protein
VSIREDRASLAAAFPDSTASSFLVLSLTLDVASHEADNLRSPDRPPSD